MDINLIVLGCLFILVAFGVGENIWKKFGISRVAILIFLALLISGLYVPNLHIKDFSISISGIVLPAIICFVFAFRIRSTGVFVNILMTGFVCLLLRLAFVELEFIPTEIQLAVMSLLGIVLAVFTKDAYGLIFSSFVGFVLGNAIFEFIKYGNINLLLQSQVGLGCAVVCAVCGVLVLFLKSKILPAKQKNLSKV